VFLGRIDSHAIVPWVQRSALWHLDLVDHPSRIEDGMAGASVSATVRVHSSASGSGLTGANAVLPITSANLAGGPPANFLASGDAGIDGAGDLLMPGQATVILPSAVGE
jgi:hypothetical protein